MEVLVDYHFAGNKEVLFDQKGQSIQGVINLLHQTKDVADKHFTALLNEKEGDLKEDPLKKKKTSENDLDDNNDGDGMEEENDNQDNKIVEEKD
ncbi:hypothetical protein TTHERM_00575370 (macronuclear) [Tetrahymena thermophila SB210]|uniref:Uncharacterized protein n=1 Tax=Tetrahymena thermophila (strain SB210) TaxID=312017 RepID=Q22V63_TETTS|nr:hypothetical protein TTHERM_00575370 [Tetrahymena thermophila SB210]EAR89085.3 hypothetical protein TTHERM_00575370 [Tetrahymena thermophila SB210]|eukprot:XP_001009330.3 hypothetical protein TTHERM_00575370 [Tetrahymena thermophila SB210]